MAWRSTSTSSTDGRGAALREVTKVALRRRAGDCRVVELVGGDQLPSGQLARTSEFGLGIGERDLHPFVVCLRADQVRLRLFDRRAEERLIQPREDLSLADDRIEVGVKRLDAARDLAADLDGRHRLERSCRRNPVDDRAAGDHVCRYDGARVATAGVERAHGDGCRREEPAENRESAFHID